MTAKKDSSEEKWDSVFPIPKLKTLPAVVVLCVLAFVSFSRSLHGAFVFDDHEAVINNKDVTSNASFYNIFVHDFWGTSITHAASHKSYRPLTILCFRFLYFISGNNLNSYMFHLFNVFLHMVVSCLTLVVYNIIFEQRCPKSSFFCAVLFAVHPVHTESVAGVVGLAELLSAFFVFSSFIIYHYGCVDKCSMLTMVLYTTTSCCLSVVAMLCKEQGITIIGVMSVYDIVVVNKINPKYVQDAFSELLRRISSRNLNALLKGLQIPELLGIDVRNVYAKSSTKFASTKNASPVTSAYSFYPLVKMFIRHGILFVITSAALYGRWLLMGSTLPTFQKIDNPASFEEHFFSRVINYNYIYLINVWILLCPEWLCFDWSMGCVPLIKAEENLFDVRIFLVSFFWSTVFILIRSTYRSKGITQRALILGLSSMVILFLPASNIFFKVGFVVAERVLYLPSFGYFLIIVVGIQKLAVIRVFYKPVQFAMFGMVFIFVLRSVNRTGDWLNERRLFESALSVCPLNAKVHYNLAKNAADRGFRKFAIKHYEEAIKLHPQYDLAMNNLANIYRDEGNLMEAQKLLTKALEIRPDFSTAWMNLGIVYSSIGSFNQSESCYLEALKHRKKYPDCYYNLGNLYLDLGRNCDALAAWRNATRLKPTHKIAWSNLIVMLDSLGRLKEALNESYNALSYLPSEPNIHFNLANVLGKLNDYENSEKHFLEAIHLNSQHPTYLYNLGVLYHRWNKFCKAKYYYSEASRLDPLSKAHQHLNALSKSGKFEGCSLKYSN